VRVLPCAHEKQRAAKRRAEEQHAPQRPHGGAGETPRPRARRGRGWC
jgi:hypothetical protein